MESVATFTLNIAPTPAGSNVTWAMDGNHNFVGKAFGLFVNMDNMLAGDLDKGLALLKTAAETRHAAAGDAAKTAAVEAEQK